MGKLKFVICKLVVLWAERDSKQPTNINKLLTFLKIRFDIKTANQHENLWVYFKLFSPSPRPSLAASKLSDVEKIRQTGSAGNGSRDRGGHVQFVPGNRNHSNSNAQIVQSRNGESDLELG